MIPLEPTLSKIPEQNQSRATRLRYRSGGNLAEISLTIFLLRAP
jgi:hypothetical protein